MFLPCWWTESDRTTERSAWVSDYRRDKERESFLKVMKRTGRFVSLTQHSSEKTHTRPGDKIQQIPGRTAHTAGLMALCEVTRALTGGVKKFDTLLIFTLCSWCKCALLCRRHCCLNAEIYLWATPSSSEGLCFIQPVQQTSTAQFVLHHHLPETSSETLCTSNKSLRFS